MRNPELKTGCRGKGVNDATIRDRSVTALPNKGIQFPPQRRKIGQLSLHVGKMCAGYGVHRFAGLLFVVGKIEQRPNLLNGKTEVTRPPCEGEAADMAG